MPIKKDVCRNSERIRMRQMANTGYTVPQISNAVSVREPVVHAVLDGTWDTAEEKQKAEQVVVDERRKKAAAQTKVDEAAAMGKAIADALKGDDSELSPQQKAANTRRANKAAAEALEAEEAFVPVDRAGNPLEEEA